MLKHNDFPAKNKFGRIKFTAELIRSQAAKYDLFRAGD